MIRTFVGILLIGGCMNNGSDMSEIANIDLNDYLWKNRVVIIFTNSWDNADYRTLKDDWNGRHIETEDRDMILIEIVNTTKGFMKSKVLGDAALQAITRQIPPQDRPFEVVLIGKDGTVKLRTTNSSLEQIFSLIDTMPMRINEMQKRKK
jgi:hypothetical protein